MDETYGVTRARPQSCKDASTCRQRISIHLLAAVALASITSSAASISTSISTNRHRKGLKGPWQALILVPWWVQMASEAWWCTWGAGIVLQSLL